MNPSIRQQIVISGVGGQGVLFVTRLLAEAAIAKGLPVFTSETHGMAQRGGTVISHLKVGDFASPLIRPGQADGLISLKAENVAQHGGFLKPEGWLVVNSAGNVPGDAAQFAVDADRLAGEIGNLRSVNLILLGAALSRTPNLFCTPDDVRTVVRQRLAGKPDMLASALKALEAGAGGE
ncbi:indolepyruvate oxidoreductase [Desulfonema ishimotonii]|uniref:Indolepyruvate oxidoreductase n=1 Tax=Desulfonema ishimotonii TaxID=45657 RepID=A0A401FQ85_9BACT|nr:indolepyruvate oxidoreductase subunit beta [Desulfonema ishimotonii]GBC59158.1 indolepyruvate oxidoreductase [Desulfonema ishimotonii]